jgi:hypothetical protein
VGDGKVEGDEGEEVEAGEGGGNVEGGEEEGLEARGGKEEGEGREVCLSLDEMLMNEMTLSFDLIFEILLVIFTVN